MLFIPNAPEAWRRSGNSWKKERERFKRIKSEKVTCTFSEVTLGTYDRVPRCVRREPANRIMDTNTVVLLLRVFVFWYGSIPIGGLIAGNQELNWWYMITIYCLCHPWNYQFYYIFNQICNFFVGKSPVVLHVLQDNAMEMWDNSLHNDVCIICISNFYLNFEFLTIKMANEPSSGLIRRGRCHSCHGALEEQRMDKIVVLVLKEPYPLLSIEGKLYQPHLR